MKEPLPNPLPVIIEGLEGRWSAGLLDLSSKKLRRLGVFENKGYLTLEVPTQNRLKFYAGNLLVSTDKSICLDLVEENGNWYIVAHNNDLKQPKTATIKTADWLAKSGILPRSFKRKLVVAAGGSVKILVS